MTTMTHATREEMLAGQYAALGNPARLHILAILREHNDGTLDVDGLVEALGERYRGLAQPTVSYHLRTLYEAGFLTCEKWELHSFYRVDERTCADLRAEIGGRV